MYYSFDICIKFLSLSVFSACPCLRATHYGRQATKPLLGVGGCLRVSSCYPDKKKS